MPFNNGYMYSTAIQAVRDTTNSNFGQPSDGVIGRFLNRAVEQMCAKLDAPLTNTNLAVVNPNSNVFTLPSDIWQLRNVTYSNGISTYNGNAANPGIALAAGVTVYEMVELPYDEFIQCTMSTPAGGLGGIPTVYTIIEDMNQVMTIQVYPLVSAGYINLYYYQRGMLWDPLVPSSTSNLDSVFQEPVIVWACAQTMHAREMDDRAAVFMEEYKDALAEAKIISGKRKRKNQSITVRDVTEGASVFPVWMR
jgi:hypothetical protein